MQVVGSAPESLAALEEHRAWAQFVRDNGISAA
jgi:hypothetical protein